MALSLDDFGPVRKGPSCSFPVILAACSKEVRDLALQAMAGDPRDYPSTRIAKVVSKHSGAKIAAETVRRHRTGVCACGA